MVNSRRQLVEKMALFWHDHFATSLFAVPFAHPETGLPLLQGQLETFREDIHSAFVEYTKRMIVPAALDDIVTSDGQNDGGIDLYVVREGADQIEFLLYQCSIPDRELLEKRKKRRLGRKVNDLIEARRVLTASSIKRQLNESIKSLRRRYKSACLGGENKVSVTLHLVIFGTIAQSHRDRAEDLRSTHPRIDIEILDWEGIYKTRSTPSSLTCSNSSLRLSSCQGNSPPLAWRVPSLNSQPSSPSAVRPSRRACCKSVRNSGPSETSMNFTLPWVSG